MTFQVIMFIAVIGVFVVWVVFEFVQFRDRDRGVHSAVVALCVHQSIHFVFVICSNSENDSEFLDS